MINPFGSALSSQVEASGRIVWDPENRHALIHADALSIPEPGAAIQKYDLAFLDFPSVEETWSLGELQEFFTRTFAALNPRMQENSAIILCYRERKSGAFWKNALGTTEALATQWQPVRQFVWRYSEAEFHRARPAFNLIYVLRRGDMPMQDSRYRYKDIITVPMSAGTDQDRNIMEIPLIVVVGMLELFSRPGYRVLDPFAGAGTTARAAQFLDLLSTSVELNPEVFSSLADRWETQNFWVPTATTPGGQDDYTDDSAV